MIHVQRYRISTSGFMMRDPLGDIIQYETYLRNMEQIQNRIRELEVLVKSLEDDIEAIYEGEAGPNL